LLKTLPRHLQPCQPPRPPHLQQEQLPWFQRPRLPPLQPHRLMEQFHRPVLGEVLDLQEAALVVAVAVSDVAVALEVLVAR